MTAVTLKTVPLEFHPLTILGSEHQSSLRKLRHRARFRAGKPAVEPGLPLRFDAEEGLPKSVTAP